ncbi:hypothetical protein BHY_1380 (plasmid) [Borrelia nietonii YOR]|uniref:Uncharacterized protein n=1 Tax=Borrelia nietonii YOR TaxID=1293576 RepID=W5SGT5_9SPIR|nr:hypothetical protein [Borrelia nietonii]AHH04331.1 hypothetical protein BHY_1380 [Borrelia nietonii YOR]UPA09957.1 hypothetical protein bhYOR_001275 [Borrelia nietonii YOR]
MSNLYHKYFYYILYYFYSAINIFANISADKREEWAKYEKYRNSKIKLLRVKEWKDNFNNLNNLGIYFLQEINHIKSLSKEDLASYFQAAFTTNICGPPSGDILPKKHKSLFDKSYKFINTLKNKNADQTAYLIYDMIGLTNIFAETKEVIDTLNYQAKREAKKHCHEYKNTLKKFTDLYKETEKEYFLAIDILDHNDIENSFCKFMIKFTKIYNSASHIHSILYDMYNKYIYTTRTPIMP